MRFQSLDAWLQWQSRLHSCEIELGLERVAKVWRLLHQGRLPFKVITIAGTNGKGSSAAFLEAILLAAGYRIGCFTSPHLIHYNERIRVNGEEVNDETICRAFERIDQARGEATLTFFEFGALAALEVFTSQPLDAVILEVGLGGRLDAINIVDPDVALITSIGIDHTEWLGQTLDEIAWEKAGIMRGGRPAVFAGREAPEALLRAARGKGVPIHLAGRDFGCQVTENSWDWNSAGVSRRALPMPHLRGAFQLRNASAVLMVLTLLQEVLPVDQGAIRRGLQVALVKGRFQVIAGDPVTILDVAHNPQAAEALAGNLRQMYCPGRTLAVFGMLSDKDVTGVAQFVSPFIDYWHLTEIESARGIRVEKLAGKLRSSGVESQAISCHNHPVSALQAAKGEAVEGDRLLVFGSFYLVGDILPLLDKGPGKTGPRKDRTKERQD